MSEPPEPPEPPQARDAPDARTTLAGLGGHFTRLGATAFGGPVAHVAMMEDEFVRRRHWLDRDSFARALAATNLVPGPNSTEMAIHLGFRRRGVPGALVAGTAFILPAALAVAILAWAYFRWGTTPRADDLFAGIRPAVVVLVALAGWRLRGPAVRTRFSLALAGAAFVVALLVPRWELVALLAAGLIALVAAGYGRRLAMAAIALPLIPSALPAFASTVPEAVPIALIHLKAGALLFGGGFVIIPLLEPDAIAQGWLSEEQFLDGIAIGQATPGPIVTTATFVGYAAGGWGGALIATIAIFAPSFFFAISLGHVLQRLAASEALRAFLDGVAAAVFGAIAGAAVVLLLALDANPLSVVVLAASVVVLLRSLLPAYAWMALCGGAGLLYGAADLPA